MTTAEAYKDFSEQLKGIYDAREADNITDWVFENVTGFGRLERQINQHIELNNSSKAKLSKYAGELLQHKPVQYVLQEAWFYKMKFYVDENVLIPRPETEELVSWLLSDIKQQPDVQDLALFEIGTGSGCISIALKKQFNPVSITAIDISENALDVARRNAKYVNADIQFMLLNFLDVDNWPAGNAYDYIISNPPYIPIAEKSKLAKNVTNFEPVIALFVPENDPFIFYKAIAKFGQTHLKPGGKIFVEVHEQYSGDIETIFNSHNFNAIVKEDIYGKKRMVRATQSK